MGNHPRYLYTIVAFNVVILDLHQVLSYSRSTQT